MPVIYNSEYKPPYLFRCSHIHTIAPSLLRKVKLNTGERLQMNTSDQDFIDYDYYNIQNKQAAIIIHGLEGNSRKPYMLGMAKTLIENGFDVFAMNMRGCSGRHNSLFISYHAGKTDDLSAMVHLVLEKYQYQNIVIVGFSLGGNIALKYAGEKSDHMPEAVKAVVAISVPCDLKSSSWKLNKFSNRLYQFRFIRSLKKKALYKIAKFKIENINKEDLKRTSNFYQFDNLFTAPVHEFKNASDYWDKCSSKPLLHRIVTPTLLVNALDDPFLTPECYPYREAEQNPNLFFETPKFGGHVGFAKNLWLKEKFWHEEKTITFIKSLLVS